MDSFFRRNSALFWILGFCMVVGFAYIQIDKAIGSESANYGFASDCTYIMEPVAEKRALTREDTLSKGCSNG